MTTKHVIHNLAGGSGFYFVEFDKTGKAVFMADAVKAKQFDTRGAAEMVLSAILPTRIQQTEENKLWNYGHLFTITEVYV